jgi:predicted Zn-dependent protease
MSASNASYCDGKSSAQQAVHLSVRQTVLDWTSSTTSGSFDIAQVRLDPAVGQTDAVIHLPTGGMFILHDASLLEAWPKQVSWIERSAAWVEERISTVIALACLAVAILYAVARWGIPLMATALVTLIPLGIDARMGEQTLAVMDRVLLAPSQLSLTRQQSLTDTWARYCASVHCPSHQLLFRHGKKMGANAFALPGGVMVLTDELVKLAQQDEEIVAVLAHELGHVHGRHGVRMVVQSMGAAAVLLAVTGDFGNVTDLASALPSLLLQTGYSRNMEREADAYAIDSLQAACVEPRHLASMLDKLDAKASETGWLDSHPGTQERMQLFAAARGCNQP